ncbi:MAG: hypothetical protein WCF23_02355 [Candidatus Nitrosopolaris sp.]
MVNYGYGSNTKCWDESKKLILADSLRKLVDEMKEDGSIKTVETCMSGNGAPYVEVDQLYKGVRIRKITHLSDEQERTLIERADKLYLSIMSDK